MAATTHSLADLEEKVAAGKALTSAEAARVMACPDLVSVGVLGESARRKAAGDTITFARVCAVSPAQDAVEIGDAGEIRLTGVPASIDEARARVRAAAARADGRAVTAFSLADLLSRCGGDLTALADAAKALKADGLEAVAETPVDRFASTEALAAAVRTVTGAGLGVWRFTVDRASLVDRLALIDRVVDVQRETGAARAFAPLPRLDPVETPSTGYDDVKTIAAARLRCPASLVVQVDWPLYGPKLAQVALAYGAGDIDGVAAVDTLGLGHRRSPAEDIARQIRAAGGRPVERSGRFAPMG
jgi:aminodeoxyfutalosine synthase